MIKVDRVYNNKIFNTEKAMDSTNSTRIDITPQKIVKVSFL